MNRTGGLLRLASMVAIVALGPWAGAAYGEGKVTAVNSLREGDVKSVGSQRDAGAGLPGASNVLSSENAARMRPTDAAKVEAQAARKAVKGLDGLQLGVFRTQNLSEGYVPPPGLAEFAAYVRAAPAVEDKTKQQQGQAQAAEPKVLVEPGSMTKEELTKQQEAENLRVKTVESIQKILQTRPDPEKKLTLLMRLVEIQVERAAFQLELEIAEFNVQHEKWKADQDGSKEPKFATTQSKAIIISAVQVLRQVVNDYPNHARTPEALFNLGFLLTQIESDNADFYFKSLVQKFPKSEYVPAAWLALGEHYFSRDKFPDALAAYRKVLAYKNTPPYYYAVYKLGWAYFNIRPGSDAERNDMMQKSLKAFQLVVALAAKEKNNGVLSGLRDQALKDLVLVYAEMRDIKGAQAFFEKKVQEPELYVNLLERLAWRHAEAGEYGPAIGIYQRLLKDNPLHPRVPEFFAKIPELNEKAGDRRKAIAALSQMAGVLAKDSAWMKAHVDKPDVIKGRTEVLSRELSTWGKRYHAEAQKTSRPDTYKEALEVYTIYLTHFGDQAESYEIHHFRGDILVRDDQFLAAANEYMAAVNLDKKHNLKGKYTLDAALNAITCYEKAIAASQAPELPKAGEVVEKIPLPTLYARLVQSIDTYEAMFPTHAHVRILAHRAANILYAFGHYSDSERRWTAMAEKWVDSAEVREGLLLSLKVHVQRKNWDGAIASSRRFLALPGVDKTKVGGELVSVLKVSTFSKALELEKTQSFDKAADTFLAYHNEFQGDPDAPKALFNAANNRFKVGKVDDAISALRTLLAQYPKSELVPQSYYLIANAFDALGQFTESAETYEQLATTLPNDPKASVSLLRAAEQRLAVGDQDRAIADAQQFVKQWPKHDGVVDAWGIVAEAYREGGEPSKAVGAFRTAANLIARTDRIRAVLFLGFAAETAAKANDMTAAGEAATIGARELANLPEKERTAASLEAARMIGLVQLKVIDGKLPNFLKKKINNGEKIVEEFKVIQAEAETLSDAYTDIVKLGNAEAGVAAMFRAAQVQEYLAKTLMEAPVPNGANPTEVETFRSTLEKIALPLQEQSANLYLAAWEKARESEALSPYVKQLHEKLTTLRPAEFRKVAEEMPRPVYYSSQIVRSPETRKVTPN